MSQSLSPCQNGAPFSSLRFCSGERVLPGIRTAIYYINKNDILEWPTLPQATDEDVTLSQLATYKGDFTLRADHKWSRIDLTTGKGNVEWENTRRTPLLHVPQQAHRLPSRHSRRGRRLLLHRSKR